MNSSLLICNARVIDPSQGLDDQCDLLIESGMVKSLAKSGKIPVASGYTTIDVSGHWLMPGLIDMHVHLREPGESHKETILTGCLAAAAGGFSTVACMANTQPVNDQAAVTAWILREAEKQNVKVLPIGAVSKGLQGEVLTEMGEMAQAGCVAFSDDGRPVASSRLMRNAMDYAKSLGVAIISHAEDPTLSQYASMHEGSHSERLGLSGSPSATEEIMVAREIALCRLTRCRVHIAHVSTATAVEMIRRAKDEGLPITAEVCPHHLLLNHAKVACFRSEAKVAPPLRDESDRLALLDGLRTGVIDCIASDHAPHASADKDAPFESCANGITGLETSVTSTYSLVQNETLTAMRWVEAMTLAPAKVLKIKVPTLAVGSSADLVLFDVKRKWKLTPENTLSLSHNSPMMDQTFTGAITATMVGGRFIYERK